MKKSRKATGRVIGVLLLVQLVGMFVAFSTLMPGIGADYLSKAAGLETTIRLAVVLLLVNATITLAISVVAFTALREHSLRAAILLIAIGAVWLAVQLVDNAHILSMLSLSKQSAEAGHPDVFSIVGEQVWDTRNLMHYTALLIVDLWFGLFYGALLAFRLVPRLLGGFGLLAVVVHAIGIALPAFLGYPALWSLAYAFPAAYLFFGGWLVAKGFPELDRISTESPC